MGLVGWLNAFILSFIVPSECESDIIGTRFNRETTNRPILTV